MKNVVNFIKDFMEGEIDLTEGTIDPKVISKVHSMTDSNNHTEALLMVAEVAGAKKIAKILEHVAKIQDLEGHLPKELVDYRYGLMKDVKKFGEQKYGKEEFAKLWNSL